MMVREKVIVNDVGPRDGLQNQAKLVGAHERSELIALLVEAGLPAIEIGSFVSPKAVPAMAGTDRIAADLPDAEVLYSALVPNRRGYELAVAAGVKCVSLVVAASDTMNQRNINMSTDEALSVCEEVIALSKNDGIETLAYVATAWECPFEGVMPVDQVVDVSLRLRAAGASELILADTIGAANPASVEALLVALCAQIDVSTISCHFHDTRAMALANASTALRLGVRKFDASIAGLGGCPFAPGASGNVATEDLVLMFEQMGYDTGIDLGKLVTLADRVSSITGNREGGHALEWLKRQVEKGQL